MGQQQVSRKSEGFNGAGFVVDFLRFHGNRTVINAKRLALECGYSQAGMSQIVHRLISLGIISPVDGTIKRGRHSINEFILNEPYITGDEWKKLMGCKRGGNGLTSSSVQPVTASGKSSLRVNTELVARLALYNDLTEAYTRLERAFEELITKTRENELLTNEVSTLKAEVNKLKARVAELEEDCRSESANARQLLTDLAQADLQLKEAKGRTMRFAQNGIQA